MKWSGLGLRLGLGLGLGIRLGLGLGLGVVLRLGLGRVRARLAYFCVLKVGELGRGGIRLSMSFSPFLQGHMPP